MAWNIHNAMAQLTRLSAELQQFSDELSAAFALDGPERIAAVRKVAEKHRAKTGARRLSAKGRAAISKAATKRHARNRRARKAAAK